MATSIIKKRLPSVRRVGNVYWWSNSWTCPGDGFLNVRATMNTAGTDAYWYIRDETLSNIQVANLTCPKANGTTMSTLVPVSKGHKYSTSVMANVANAYADYYEFY